MKNGRTASVRIPYNFQRREVKKDFCPGGSSELGVVIMRPFGGGVLLRKAPSDKELAPLNPFGVNTWFHPGGSRNPAFSIHDSKHGLPDPVPRFAGFAGVR
jgi:hypothetical protein